MRWQVSILDAPIQADLNKREGLKNAIEGFKQVGGSVGRQTGKIALHVLAAILVMAGTASAVWFAGYGGKWVWNFGMRTMDSMMSGNEMMVIGTFAGIGVGLMSALLINQVDWNKEKVNREPSRKLNAIAEASGELLGMGIAGFLVLAAIVLGLLGAGSIIYLIATGMDSLAPGFEFIIIGGMFLVGIVVAFIGALNSSSSSSNSK
ncbi:MAG: hypothetical protein GY810_24795 [Aureispira sp.]|nr:hypothetical protein [Aureispira sp.]